MFMARLASGVRVTWSFAMRERFQSQPRSSGASPLVASQSHAGPITFSHESRGIRQHHGLNAVSARITDWSAQVSSVLADQPWPRSLCPLTRNAPGYRLRAAL